MRRARRRFTPIWVSFCSVKFLSAPPEKPWISWRRNESSRLSAWSTRHLSRQNRSPTRIAPTENDTTFRKRLLQGEVHDENAFAMGGVAGHAGMFSTAPDLAAFCQMLLNGGMYAHQRLLDSRHDFAFTAPQPLAAGTRTLGWMVPTPNSSSGRYFSAHSFGHLGFTGTSIWIDPDRQLFVILLTNRVYPTRANDKIAAVRPAVHDAVDRSPGLAPSRRLISYIAENVSTWRTLSFAEAPASSPLLNERVIFGFDTPKCRARMRR